MYKLHTDLGRAVWPRLYRRLPALRLGVLCDLRPARPASGTVSGSCEMTGTLKRWWTQPRATWIACGRHSAWARHSRGSYRRRRSWRRPSGWGRALPRTRWTTEPAQHHTASSTCFSSQTLGLTYILKPYTHHRRRRDSTRQLRRVGVGGVYRALQPCSLHDAMQF